MRYVLGVDAGGTQTRCCMADSEGQILGYALGGPANKNFVDPEAAKAAVTEPLNNLLGSVESPAHIDAAVMTGAHLHPDINGILSDSRQVAKILSIDEFEASLAAGLCATGQWKPQCPGAVIMAGTGSFCKGRNSQGETRYAGGWGPLIGDEGSGYAIGREALRAMAKSADGRGKTTALTRAVMGHFNIPDPADIRKPLYDPPLKRHELAGLAPLAFEAAETGDGVAQGILKQAGRDLAQLAEPVLGALFDEKQSFPIVLSGGILARKSDVTRALATEIEAFRPNAEMIFPELQPVYGALVIGLDSVGVDINSGIIDKWRRDCHAV